MLGAGCAGCASEASFPPAASDAVRSADSLPQLTLTTDRDTLRRGERVVLTLTASHPGAPPLTLHFRTSQRYDFSLETAEGVLVWRWSAGRFFLQVLGEETLGPERPALVFRDSFAGSLPPGTYILRGTLTSTPPLSVSREITVRR